MTEAETVALRWIEKHIRYWRCNRCGREWLTGRSLVGLFHRCDAPPRRSWAPSYILDRERQTQEWAKSVLGDALTRAVEERDGDDALLRRSAEVRRRDIT